MNLTHTGAIEHFRNGLFPSYSILLWCQRSSAVPTGMALWELVWHPECRRACQLDRTVQTENMLFCLKLLLNMGSALTSQPPWCTCRLMHHVKMENCKVCCILLTSYTRWRSPALFLERFASQGWRGLWGNLGLNTFFFFFFKGKIKQKGNRVSLRPVYIVALSIWSTQKLCMLLCWQCSTQKHMCIGKVRWGANQNEWHHLSPISITQKNCVNGA